VPSMMVACWKIVGDCCAHSAVERRRREVRRILIVSQFEARRLCENKD